MPIEIFNKDLSQIDQSKMNHGSPVAKEISRSLRSEVIQEIVSDKPDAIIRWGTTVFFIILCLMVIVCWLVKYPDIVPAQAKLTSINAPKPVISSINAKLVKLKISEDQVVRRGEILGYLESLASHDDVLNLSANIDTIQILLSDNKTDELQRYLPRKAMQLGELQAAYQTFSEFFIFFNDYLSNGFYLKKKVMLLRDRSNLIRLHQNLIEQKALQEQDLILTQKTFDANESLQRDKVISDFDYRSEQSKLINKKLTLPQLMSAIITNESNQNEKEKEILELENTIDQQKMIFQQTVNTFKSQTDDWKKKYTLTASIDGKVAFPSFVQENQQLEANQTVVFINPENSEYFAEIVIPQSNFGKVEVGQQVLLKFDSYPFQEYGIVKGKIEFISRVPSDKGYLAKVSLLNSLNTTYGRQLQFRDGLLATAEIVTMDMRLLERFFNNVAKHMNQ